ncbi:MAG: thiolase family protein [Anaerolineae bacterium]
MERLCIVAAKRTPQGRFLGALARRSAVELAVAASQAALVEISPQEIDLVILGNVLAAGQGMNIARQVGISLGIPVDRPAYTVNMMCASGMQAIILAGQAIRSGEARVVLCGGAESMSNAPYLLDRARGGYRLGDGVLLDTLLRDGLVDTFSNEHMGVKAELLATMYGISREEQDAFALSSQRKWAAAHANGSLADELVAVDGLEQDEHPRPETTAAKLASLTPAFQANGTATAGNSAGINDGAAMLLVCGEALAAERGWRPLAVLTASVSIGCEPSLMGLGPVHATRRLCQRHGLCLGAFDAIEINEAFAAQTLACVRELGLDAGRLNTEGGAIAIGHPIGASGARLVVHLAHRIARGEVETGLATLCIGGGMGSAMALAKT